MSLGAYKAANATTYTGLSTDTKPTSVAIGDKYIATDTATLYIYLGTTKGWIELGVLGGSTALSVACVL